MSLISMSLILLITVAAWIAAIPANRYLYNRLIGHPNERNAARDLAALLGPLGTITLLVGCGLLGFNKLCARLGTRYADANDVALIGGSLLIPWLGSGVANYIWYNRMFSQPDIICDGDSRNVRDMLVAFGLFGSVLLGLLVLGKLFSRRALS